MYIKSTSDSARPALILASAFIRSDDTGDLNPTTESGAPRRSRIQIVMWVRDSTGNIVRPKRKPRPKRPRPSELNEQHHQGVSPMTHKGKGGYSGEAEA